METNVIHCMDNVEGLQMHIPDSSIDLTVTSPPYDDLRDYEGYKWNFKKLAEELYRVTKEGGVVVWITADQTIYGSETLNSFKQAIEFKNKGFNVHDTMIYQKDGTLRESNASINNKKYKEKSRRFNIWEYGVGNNKTTKDKFAYKHPAMFPEKLAKDHIKSWSNEGDIVLDPFIGSGTTAKMAELLNRKWIGFEISQKYVNIAYKRVGKLDKSYYEQLPEKEKPRQTQLF